jgi:hypothetical protein
MDDNAPKENPPADFNKLDLSQLQGFSFGTQWTQEKPSAPEQRDREGGERPRREDRREGPGGGAPDRRDRRTFRRPANPGGEGGGQGAPAAAPAGGGAGERRDFSGGRPRPQGGGGDYRGGPRREGGYGGGPRYQHGSHGGYGGRGAQERGPYDSPYYSVTFYPEDTSFNTLVQTIRKSCRTVELFEIARTVVAKTDRFVVVVTHKPQSGADTSSSRPDPAAPGAAAAESAPAPAKPAKPLFHISVPDGIPFESDDGAVAHVLSKHLDTFFDTAEVDVDPPKGNFQVINKCGITGELLGPPNYHRYNQIVQQHYAAKVASRMGPDAFRSRIETIRDPEVVSQWLAKMKKTTRYTWKFGPTGTKPAAAAPTPEPVADAATPAPAGEPAEAPAAPAADAPAPVVSSTPTFDTLEDARVYLLTQARDKVVRTAESARFHGKMAETMPPGEIRRAIEGALERQRRFPLDTANALRGRLRREHFTIFKKGSKGVSYVCAVKRKFRVPGQTFADSIGALIGFIEANPMIRASELAPNFLGISLVPPARPPEAAAPVSAETSAGTEASPAPAPAGEPPKMDAGLSLDERAKFSRLQGDLMWLVREGYVTEFIDGRLFAPPPMVEARKKEIESEDHDPENFPEAPLSSEASAPAPGAPPAQEQQAPLEQAHSNLPTAPTEQAAPSAPEPDSTAERSPAPEPAPAPEVKGEESGSAPPVGEPSANPSPDSGPSGSEASTEGDKASAPAEPASSQTPAANETPPVVEPPSEEKKVEPSESSGA